MENDNKITDEIEKVGYRHLCPVSELIQGDKIHKCIRNVPIIYRWWFPEDSPIMNYLREYVKSHAEDHKMKYLLEHGLRRITIGSTEYYALYFGKSDEGRTRFSRHINGPEKDSTLRKTIRAILTLMKDRECNRKKRIYDILSECYFEWTEFLDEDKNLIHSFEVMAIAIGYYPLNLDDNPSISEDKWGAKITEQRTILNKTPITK